jgi:hypothetical protein
VEGGWRRRWVVVEAEEEAEEVVVERKMTTITIRMVMHTPWRDVGLLSLFGLPSTILYSATRCYSFLFLFFP